MRRLLSLSFLTGALVASGCDKSAPATEKPAAEPAAGETPAADPLASRPVVENTQAQVGDVTECPWTGKRFEVKEDSPRWEYNGKTYVFCAQKALDEVQKDPEKYLGPADAPASEGPPEDAAAE